MKRAAIALAGALVLAGCPIPQPLPEYEAGTITPPRIVVDDSVSQIAFPGTAILVPPDGCSSTAPSYPLSASLVDVNTVEQIVARWFVNYDAADPVRKCPEGGDIEIPGTSSTATRRTVPTFTFYPHTSYGKTVAGGNGTDGKEPGTLQVVELVVSNGFDPAVAVSPLDTRPGSGALPPFRRPASGFETQMFRWVFVTSSTCP